MDVDDGDLSILNFFEDVPFSLPPLQDAGKQIRLLEILPDLGTKNEICCTMHVRELDDPELRYTAVSYTWGEPKPRRFIYVDGRPLQVGPNCWHALWQVKNNVRPSGAFQKGPKLDHAYWVDSICINQKDVEEKGIQVAAMGKIYSYAVSVAVCIGYESHDNPLFDEQFAWRWRTFAPSQLKHEKDMLFELIEHLLRRPYFSRLWTVQECIMAKDIQVFCGSRCVRWRMLRAQLKLTNNSHRRPPGFAELEDFFRDIDSSQQPQGRRPFSISSLIRQYSTRGCAVPHDRLYGLLSMTQEHVRKRVIVDYNLPLLDLLWNYAEAISDHEIVAGRVETKSDTQAGTYQRYSTISLLTETFFVHPEFMTQILLFWQWRFSTIDPKRLSTFPWSSPLEQSSSIYHQKVTKVHCHRINFETDSLSLEEPDGWKESSQNVDQWREWGTDRQLVTKQWVDHPNTVRVFGPQRQHPVYLTINCSDNPQYPGEMHFVTPAHPQTGDFLVPMEQPAHRAYFYLLCRPDVECAEMPLTTAIVGLAVCLREPYDSRAYMPWLRDKHVADIYLRPYDLIAIALLEDSGFSHFDLPPVEKSDVASRVLIRKATKEEIGY